MLAKILIKQSQIPQKHIKLLFTFWNGKHILAFWLIIEGTTEKALQFIRQLKLIYHKTLVSSNKNVFWNTPERFKQEKVY